MKLGDSIPTFDDRVEWLDGIKLERHTGRPLLVHFWSTGCPLCHEGSELVNEWRSRYGAGALDVIAVFAPRPETTSFDIEAVRRDARDLMHIDHPCIVDRHRDVQNSFECPYAPGYFVFDADGKLRHRQMGNDALANIGALIDRLIAKASSSSGA